MNSKKVQVLQPTFFKDFKCDGTICEDNCCVGKWNIFVDKEHYQKLKAIKDIEFKKRIAKHIKRNRKDNSNNGKLFGKIIHDEDTNSCPFLSENKLCELQNKFGWDYLCIVCKSYPRHPNLINGELERTLTLSCPIAAKIILMEQEGFGFENVEENVTNIIGIGSIYNLNGFSYMKKAEKYFWDIRTFSIQIIKSRDYEIWERLLIIGLFLENIIKLEEEDQVDDVPKVIENFAHKITSGIFKGAFDNLPTIIDLKIKLIQEIIDERIYTSISCDRYTECCEETLKGLNFSTDLEKVKNVYINSYEKYYKPYIADKGYILENYFVNTMFMNYFPFGRDMSMWENYLLIILNYSIINMHMIGMMEFHKENYTDEHTLKIIQAFAKAYEHNPMFNKEIVELIKRNGYDTMAYLTILLKN